MMTSRTYRAAIVGCGRKGSTIDDTKPYLVNYVYLPAAHAAACRQLQNVQLVAAASRTTESLHAFGERWGVRALYTDYREMLEREKPDLVSVTTHAPLHAAVTIAAAETGVKGVLCEKAIACSLLEADAMIAACARSGTKLAVGYPRRWHPTFQRAKMALDSGVIGSLRSVYGGISGGLLHNGTHLFDVLRFLAGEVAWVAGRLIRSKGTVPYPNNGRYPDDVEGRGWLAFHSGVTGFIDGASGLGLTVRLTGDSGHLLIDPVEDGFEVTTYETQERPDAVPWYAHHAPFIKRTTHCPNEPPTRGTVTEMIGDLITWIEGGPPVRCTGEDGRAALEIALALHASDRSGGAPVQLPLEDRALRVESR
jgi:predicted dehydrogenase